MNYSFRVAVTALLMWCAGASVQASVVGAEVLNPTTVELKLNNGGLLTLDFYSSSIFRVFLDPKGGIQRNPEAKPEAEILVKQPRRRMGKVTVEDKGAIIEVRTVALTLRVDKEKESIEILQQGPVTTLKGIGFEAQKVKVGFTAKENEYFYGGGVQNGRFSHRGQIIDIVNTNNWTDGGVASPTPFYWSTAGYGVLFHTFAPGRYDFGATEAGSVRLQHDTDYADFFVMVDHTPVALLKDFYQLTGNPVLLPKFAFYEGHLNAYNRDFWKETDKGGVTFEDGKNYKEAQKDNGGVKESLNGEKDNYQFSARAVVDRYLNNDFPLGWILPNDGYGAGYGQTNSLEGNVQNLKEFGDYARSKGVEIGLWTQSDLHPKEGVEPLLQRDIVREVRDAGVRVLKTDVAWVGAGYSFGLNGVANVGEIMPYYGKNARPFIISLDGWAGTQRYAGIWTGDQTGGEWEYIRFHIPTYIGAGLSGQPNISSDMDGIFGGKNMAVNVRDFQWKTFTPMQLNMDGWGSNPKYPQALGEPATSLNRAYLKMKSALMPYAYTIAHTAVTGKPMIRAMFLEEDNAFTRGTATRYQYMYGPALLVAPVYEEGDVRNGIYLPEGDWEDAFTGVYYKGGRMINEYDTPLWKLPVFVKRGSVIPFTAAHNVPRDAAKNQRSFYIVPKNDDKPHGFRLYDDDGTTQAYLNGEGAYTLVLHQITAKGKMTVTIDPTLDYFEGMEKRQATTLVIRTDAPVDDVTVKVGKKKVKENFEYTSVGKNFFSDYLPEQTETMGLVTVHIDTVDVTKDVVTVELRGVKMNTTDVQRVKETPMEVAPKAQVEAEPYALNLRWEKMDAADYYEVHFEGQTYSTIRSNAFTLKDLKPETTYTMAVRAVNAANDSPWDTITTQTAADPLRFAIHGIEGEISCPDQDGQEVKHLFDFDATTLWHTDWYLKATPFTIEMDLKSVNVLDKLEYLPREDAGNGTIMGGSVEYSMDRQHWTKAGDFAWKRTGKMKAFDFTEKPTARYVRLNVDTAAGNFGSGHELYVYRVAGSESYIPGDINHDQRIDENDLTSYMNYTGLRKGDGDFEGYISKGDLNGNGLIDAYDISNVAIELEDGVSSKRVEPVAGMLVMKTNKTTVKADEEVVLTLNGQGLRSVNAWSCAIPYDAQVWEYVGVETTGTKEMHNLTNDRLHTNGEKVLYPTFVNCGEHPYLEGDGEMLKLRFKAKRKTHMNLRLQNVMLVDKELRTLTPTL